MPRLPGPDEPQFFLRDPATEVQRTRRDKEDKAALRALDSVLLRRRAELEVLDEDDIELGPHSRSAARTFDDRVRDLIAPFAGSQMKARVRSLADTHRKAFESRSALTEHQRGERRAVKTLERLLEDSK